MPTLNIKDPEVYQLAHELAERRGTSMTAAVREALKEALTPTADERAELIKDIMEIARRSAAMPEPFLTDDDLYDEWGLPK